VEYMRKTCKFSVGKPEQGDHMEHQDWGGRIILDWILKKMVGSCGMDPSASGQGLIAGSSERGNDP
jgi:hypothetical protein